MTWNAFHHRGETLRQAVAIADARADGVLPMDVAGVTDCFDDELDLLSAMMLKWHTRLAGNIERALGEQPLDLEAAVIEAWVQTRRALPGVRAVIDRAAALPADTEIAKAVARAQQREWARLAIAAGVANDISASSAHRGRDIEAAARDTFAARGASPTTPEPVRAPDAAPSRAVSAETAALVERIKAVLAA